MATAPYIVFPNSSFGDGALPLSQFLKLEIQPPVTDGLVFACDLTRQQKPVNTVTGSALAVTGTLEQDTYGSTLTPYKNYVDTGITPPVVSTYFAIVSTKLLGGTRLFISSYNNDENNNDTSGDSLGSNGSGVRCFAVNTGSDGVVMSSVSKPFTDYNEDYIAIYGTINDDPRVYAGYLGADGSLNYSSAVIGGTRDTALLKDTLLLGSNYSVTQRFPNAVNMSCAVIYNRKLVSEEITQVLDYLRNDWGGKIGLFS